MNIAWIGNGLPGTGGARCMLEPARRLEQDYEHEVTFYLQDGASGDSEKMIDNRGWMPKIKRLDEYKGADIAICSDPGRGAVPGDFFEKCDCERKYWYMLFYNDGFTKWVRNPKFIKIAHSSWFYKIASEVDSPDRAIKILGGVDIRFWNYQTPPENKNVLIFPKKAGYVGIEAMQKVYEKDKDVVMWNMGRESIYGEGDYGVPNVEVGAVCSNMPKIKEAYHGAAVYLNSESNYGWGFSQCLAEGMSCGVPIVGGDWEGFGDMLIHEKTALISKNDAYPEIKGMKWLTRPDPNELAENILRILNDRKLQVRLSVNARMHIAKFSYDKVAKQLNEVFNENS